jgi:hypothetical protein
MHWPRKEGFDIVDPHSQKCIDLIAEFQRIRMIYEKNASAKRDYSLVTESLTRSRSTVS